MTEIQDDYGGDVVLRINGQEFQCRRKELAMRSPYFEAMFTHRFVEKDKRVIDMQGVEPEAMEVVLKFIQTNEIPSEILNSDMILSVLQASSMLQFEDLKKTCVRLIAQEWLTVETCLQTMHKTFELDIIELYKKAKAFALWEFFKVKLSPSFTQLTIEQLEDYLSNDGLNVREGEFEVFEAGMNWLQENPERAEYTCRVLQCVRFSQLSGSDIKTMLLYPISSAGNKLLRLILHLKEACGHSSDEEAETSAVPDLSYEDDKLSASVTHSQISQPCSKMNSLECQSICCCLKPIVHTSDGNFEKRASNEDLVKSVSEFIEGEKNADDLVSEDLNPEMKEIAAQLVNTPARFIPLVPCIVGHRVVHENRNPIKRIYVIYFEGRKLMQPMPLLHLSKINEGVHEPVGYQVISRGRELFIIGGEYFMGHANWNKSIWKYDIFKEDWTYETSLPSPRRHHAVCCLNDEIYVIGGFGRHRLITASVTKYNVVTRSWIECSSLPQNMYSVACCVYQGYIFVFGIEVYIYHVGSDVWHTFREPPITNNMAFNSAMPYEESIYLTGAYSCDLIKFSPYITTSETSAEHETVGAFYNQPSGACLIHDKIYAFSTDESGHMSVELYDIKKKCFQTVWEGCENEIYGIVDFNPKSNVGCFPMCLY
ncbi:kelch-like protein 38 isoform X1 [Schistocerca nitens]|uniref:kelch-like protein 38 isoform X1 n=2 Tax=Schistocerca nitens TaxID=7011 RepID=UPI00211959CF|nr:kelch-like protein 38 isoform X1 [Schistocerca nitens]